MDIGVYKEDFFLSNNYTKFYHIFLEWKHEFVDDFLNTKGQNVTAKK